MQKRLDIYQGAFHIFAFICPIVTDIIFLNKFMRGIKMAISKEKLDKIKEINSDNSDFIIRINEYLNYKHEYISKENVHSDIKELCADQYSHILLFSLQDLSNSEINYLKIENIKWKESQSTEYYYAGREYTSKLRFYKEKVNELYKTNTKNFKKVLAIIDISSVSSYPLWNTTMRRRIKDIIERIEKAELKEISEGFINKVIEDSQRVDVEFNNKYDIDFVIETLREIAENTSITPYFIDNENTNESIYLTNELQKYIYALSLEKDARYEYIYDTVCKDMDEMFSIFGFCNFKENKCVAQRHKTFFNRYPVPETDGCCFKVVRKCEHNNKDGTCKVKCLPCKLFTCPYLGKLDVGIRASELILMRSFFNNKQKRTSIHKFYNSKEFLLKRIKEQE